MGKKIVGIEIVDAEKRKVPSKHYVFIIVVRWSDGSCFKIYRRYSRFFDLQTVLLDSFPIEGGTLDPNKRVIPFLPGKIFFGRSHIKEVAMKRLVEINEYCQNLIALPTRISQCDHVLEFFEVEPDDLDPPSIESKKGTPKEKKAEKISKPKRLECFVAVNKYEAQAPGELALQPGMKVEVLEKNDIGWWFVNSEEEQGWVPSTFLEPEEGTVTTEVPRALPGEEEMFVCIENFHASNEDEISLEKGVAVSVIQKNMDGWWLIRYQGKEAFAPGTYLKKANNANRMSLMEKSRLSGVEIISSLQDVSTLLNTDKKTQEKAKPEFAPLDQSEKPAFPSAFVKQCSLERGGSLIPPPRQNSITKMDPPTLSQKSAIYMTIESFTDTVGDGISFEQGQKVLVLEKTSTGWWLVRLGEEEGWVPASYLESYAGNLDTSSVYELANLQETDDDDEDSGSDGEWYTEPDDMMDGGGVSGPPPPPPIRGKSKRPLPDIPTDNGDYEPVDEVHKISTRPLPPPPPENGDKPSLMKNEISAKLPTVNNQKKHVVPKRDAKDDKEKKLIPVRGASDLASVLKAKFESRAGEASDDHTAINEDKNIKTPKAVVPTLPTKPSEMKKQQNEVEKVTPSVPSNNSDQNKNKPFAKPPPPPSKSKTSNAFPNLEKKPESSPSLIEKVTPSVASNDSDQNKNKPFAKPPPPPSKSKTSNVFPNLEKKSESSPSLNKNEFPKFPLKPVASREGDIENKNVAKHGSNIKNMAAALDKSLNSQPSATTTAKVPVPPKPQIPSKPKPSVPSKPPLAAKPKPAIQPKANQNVNNIASALNSKLNFGKSTIQEKSENGYTSNSNNTNSVQKPSIPKLPPAPSKVSPKTKSFVALYDFVGEVDSELSLREGDSVEILEENGDWVFIKLGDEQGWAPAAYIQEK